MRSIYESAGFACCINYTFFKPSSPILHYRQAGDSTILFSWSLHSLQIPQCIKKEAQSLSKAPVLPQTGVMFLLPSLQVQITLFRCHHSPGAEREPPAGPSRWRVPPATGTAQAQPNAWRWRDGGQETPGLTQVLNSALGRRGIIQSAEMERKPARGQDLSTRNYSTYSLFHLFVISISTGIEHFLVSPFAKSILRV